MCNLLMDDLINYCSSKKKEFKYYREPEPEMKRKGKALDKKLFVLQDTNKYYYDNKYHIGVEDSLHYPLFKYIGCSCISFHKNYICKHCVAVAFHFGYYLKGFSKPPSFAYNRRRAKTNKTPKAGKALQLD